MGSIQRERQPSMQREDQTDHGNGPGTDSSESAVNHLSKSVVRESRTPRSVGTGGGRPPPVTRSGEWQRSPATRPWEGRRLVDSPLVMRSAANNRQPASGQRHRSRKRFVAARLRGKAGRAATKRLLLLHPDFHTSDAEVQAGAFGVGSDLHDDTCRILEIAYATAANQSGTGRGSRIGAREVVHTIEFINVRSYDVRAAADISQSHTGSGKRIIFIFVMKRSASPGIAHTDGGRSAGEIDSRVRCGFLFLSRNRE